MKEFWKRLLCRGPNLSEKVAQKGDQVQMIKDQSHIELRQIAIDIKNSTLAHSLVIDKNIKRIDTIASQIAIATGGRNRGL